MSAEAPEGFGEFAQRAIEESTGGSDGTGRSLSRTPNELA